MKENERRSPEKQNGYDRYVRFKRGIKAWIWQYRLYFFTALVAVIVIAVAGSWIANKQAKQENEAITANHQVNVGSGYRDITYRGKQYRYNTRITCILYAGIDSVGEITANAVYTQAPRADSISLVVLDEYHKKMTVIGLSRDTMTEIRRYTLNGRDRGLFVDHLGYAFAYGDGGEVSCRNLCEAVSSLLYGVPISEYVVSNRSSLSVIGELVGSVTVRAPNNDLADVGILAGQTVTLDASNLETFLRSRDTETSYSNTGRMERQQAYINAAMGQLRASLDTNSTAVWETLEAASASVLTNITRNRYLDLIKAMRNTSYSGENYYTPAGTQAAGEKYDEFYPDEDALLAKVIELFYIPK